MVSNKKPVQWSQCYIDGIISTVLKARANGEDESRARAEYIKRRNLSKPSLDTLVNISNQISRWIRNRVECGLQKVGNMQTETIIKKFKLEFEKFDDWVYIKCPSVAEPYLLPRKFFDEMEAKYAKGKVPYNWLLKIKWVDTYTAFSEDYLKQYFETGRWEPNSHDTWIVDPLPLLKAGVKDRYYQANVTYDGFLHLDGKPIRRPYQFALHGYKLKEKLVKLLLKHPKIISAELKDIPHYDYEVWNEQQSIHVLYMP
ncbi:hypothetical protein LCGC14_2214580 [marine sediment metagenome]|uniref:Uncharacterized protein n=1 Tax=marine sediment metagenome TaxID=412755 RepID=A0A0F9G8E3_9ZZZZ